MQPDIVEVSIRDGSYEVGFQFQPEDVVTIARTLDEARFRYIEVGHGMGLGANTKPWRNALDRSPFADADHFSAARAAVRHGRLGVPYFPHPDVDFHEIEIARECGLDFIRIIVHAVDLSDEQNQQLVRFAKELGLEVSVNFLKTYADPPDVVSDKAQLAQDLGADWLYIVDSAGCMEADEVRAYVRALVEGTNLRIGFHGHNNMSLALSNSIAALDAGATLVDSSLQGLGRATGNAPTEMLVGYMQTRLSLVPDIDRRLVFAAGRKVRRYVEPGFEPVHHLSGLSRIHSSQLPIIRDATGEEDLDLEDVLLPIGDLARRRNKLNSRNLPAQIIFEGIKLARQSKAHSSYDEFVDDLAATLAEHDHDLEDVKSAVSALMARARRDHLDVYLIIVPGSASTFAGPGLIQAATWAAAILVGDPVSILMELSAPESVSRWLRSIFVDERLGPPTHVHEALKDLIQPVNVVDAIAESIVGGRTFPSAVLRCADRELAEALRGRLWATKDILVLVDNDSGRTASPTSLLVVENDPDFLESPEAEALLGKGALLVVLGTTQCPKTVASMIESNTIELLVPNWPAVLVNRHAQSGRTCTDWSGPGFFVVDPRHGMLAVKESRQPAGRIKSFPEPSATAAAAFYQTVRRESLRSMLNLQDNKIRQRARVKT